MAGETTKTTALTNADSGIKREARLNRTNLKVGIDHYQFAAATSLEAGDNLITNIKIPSNAIILEIKAKNDDLDTAACPTLVADIGVAAAADYTSTTSGTDTNHSADDIIDADLLIDGSTQFQAANANWVSVTGEDATTWGPDDSTSMVWEMLGYDEDPHTEFNIVFQSQAAAAALASAGDLALLVYYTVD